MAESKAMREKKLAEQCIATADELRLHRPRKNPETGEVVDRSSLFFFFVESKGFASLPAYGNAELSVESRFRNNGTEGMIVGDECFTREPDVSQGQSLRNYINKVVFASMRENGLTPPSMDKVVTAVEELDGRNYIVIYRRK